MTRPAAPSIRTAFEEMSLRIPLAAIRPLREVPERARSSIKYAQIAASIAEVGIIEPPVVTRDGTDPDIFHLLDGHIRVQILRDRGATEVVCLVATEDEAFTYNKRINRINVIQEHKMILNAISKGVPEERLARALNVNIANIRLKRNLLVGICPEAADLLKDKPVPILVFTELRLLKPIRQIEVAQSMVTMGRYTVTYVKSLVAATSAGQLVGGRKRREPVLKEEQQRLMQRETENLDREFAVAEQGYAADHLDLVLASAYVRRLLDNAPVVRHLAEHHAQLLSELQRAADVQPSS